MLNVFLAIAVDNVANAQVLTKDMEEENQLMEEQKKIRNVVYSPQLDRQNKGSKWARVRCVPKMLMFTKEQKKEANENPFKGVTYKTHALESRDLAMLR